MTPLDRRIACDRSCTIKKRKSVAGLFEMCLRKRSGNSFAQIDIVIPYAYYVGDLSTAWFGICPQSCRQKLDLI